MNTQQIRQRARVDNVCVLEEGHDNVTWHPMLHMLDKTVNTAKETLNAAYWQVEGIRALADAIAAQLKEQP
jgi:hypothetical protein